MILSRICQSNEAAKVSVSSLVKGRKYFSKVVRHKVINIALCRLKDIIVRDEVRSIQRQQEEVPINGGPFWEKDGFSCVKTIKSMILHGRFF